MCINIIVLFFSSFPILDLNIIIYFQINNMALRWGIASSGLIASDFATALKGLPKGEHQVVAVAARSLAR